MIDIVHLNGRPLTVRHSAILERGICRHVIDLSSGDVRCLQFPGCRVYILEILVPPATIDMAGRCPVRPTRVGIVNEDRSGAGLHVVENVQPV